MFDDSLGRTGGSGSDQGEFRGLGPIGSSLAGIASLKNRILAGFTWALGAASAVLVLYPYLPGARVQTKILAFLVVVFGLAVPLVKPRIAFASLLVAAGFLPGLPRVWSDFGAPPLLLVLAVGMAGAFLSKFLIESTPSPLDHRIWKWGGAFLAVALASAVASGLRGHTLYFLLRGGVEPHVVNSLGMLARDRAIAAAQLFLVFACLLPLLDAGVRLFRAERTRLMWIATVAASVAGLAGILSGVLPQESGSFWLQARRASGLMTDPNALGIGLALLAPLCFAALLEKSVSLRIAAAVSLLILAAALEKSGSRSGLMLASVAGVAAGVAIFRRGGRGRQLVAGVAGAMVVLVISAVLLLPRQGSVASGGLLDRIGAALQARSLAQVSNHRNLFWSAAFSTIEKEPLSGCGLAGFAYEFPVWFEKSHGLASFTDNTTNGFLDIAAECGIPGLLLALLAAGPVLFAAAGELWQGRPKTAISVAAAASLAGFFVILFWGSHVRNPEVAIWMLVPGLCVAPLRNEVVPREDEISGPSRAGWVLVVSGVLSSFLALNQTSDAGWAFRGEKWAGLHGRGARASGLEGGAPQWSGPSLFRRIQKGERSIRLGFKNLRPDERSVLALVDVDGRKAGAVAMGSGEERWLRVESLPFGAGVVRVRFTPTFVPSELTGGTDTRELGVVVLPVAVKGAS